MVDTLFHHINIEGTSSMGTTEKQKALSKASFMILVEVLLSHRYAWRIIKKY